MPIGELVTELIQHAGAWFTRTWTDAHTAVDTPAPSPIEQVEQAPPADPGEEATQLDEAAQAEADAGTEPDDGTDQVAPQPEGEGSDA